MPKGGLSNGLACVNLPAICTFPPRFNPRMTAYDSTIIIDIGNNDHDKFNKNLFNSNNNAIKLVRKHDINKICKKINIFLKKITFNTRDFIKKDYNIYFIFSSISFLQLYIPIVIESKKRGYKNIFIIRENKKDYANPLNSVNSKILNEFLKLYSIRKIYHENINLKLITGLVFMVDGDIYGPPKDIYINDSLLFKLNKNNTTCISLTEHMNFWDIYHKYINNVDYCFFSNKNQIKQIKSFKNNIYQEKNLKVNV